MHISKEVQNRFDSLCKKIKQYRKKTSTKKKKKTSFS